MLKDKAKWKKPHSTPLLYYVSFGVQNDNFTSPHAEVGKRTLFCWSEIIKFKNLTNLLKFLLSIFLWKFL